MYYTRSTAAPRVQNKRRCVISKSVDIKEALHEISQPLLAIAAYADTASLLADKQDGIDPTINECVDAIRVEANRAIMLLKKIREEAS